MKKRTILNINQEKLITFIFSLIYAAMFLYLFFSNTYKHFLHKRMGIFMLFAGIVFIFFAYVSFIGLKSKEESTILKSRYLIYFLPILVFVILPNDNLYNQGIDFGRMMTKNSMSYTFETADNQKITVEGDDYEKALIESVRRDGKNEEVSNKPLDIENGVINIRSENFISDITELGSNLDKYVGKQIKISGYLFKDKDLTFDRYIVSRLYMYCCAADAFPVGPILKDNKDPLIKPNTWVSVEGTIEKIDIDGMSLIQINPTHIEKADEPDDIYVY